MSVLQRRFAGARKKKFVSVVASMIMLGNNEKLRLKKLVSGPVQITTQRLRDT